jgi:hypothetical protein
MTMGWCRALTLISRFGDCWRAPGAVEPNSYNTGVDKIRCEAIVKPAFALLPQAAHRLQMDFRFCMT